MTAPSSLDLHPARGGRFVLVLEPPAHEYSVAVYLPGQPPLESTLRWVEGRAELSPPLSDAWAQAETLKLARVLHQSPKSRITRWRARP